MDFPLTPYRDLKAMDIADHMAGFSALRCKCEQMLTQEQERHIQNYGQETTCARCGEMVWIENVYPMVEPRSIMLMEDVYAPHAIWYHATNNPTWMESLLSFRDHKGVSRIPLVHIGTKNSALERAETERYDYLYTLTLKPGTSIHPDIVVDDNSWTQYVDETVPFSMPADGLRYINIWESAGSISMLIDPRALDIVSMQSIPRSQSATHAA